MGNEKIVDASRRLMARTRRFCEGRTADRLLGIWSFAEATVWFILPDFLLLPYAVAAPGKIRRWLMIALACSLTGTLLLLLTILLWPEAMSRIIMGIPFTNGAMVDRLESVQVPGILSQSVSGIPAKAWTLAALKYEWPVPVFLLLLAISRGLRMAAVLLIGRWLAEKPWVTDYWLLWLLLYIPIFLLSLSVLSNR